MIPTKCLIFCKTKNMKISLVHAGKSCICLSESTLTTLAPTIKSECNEFCSGDEKQFCGDTDAAEAFITDCDDGWTRFGDSCYKQLKDDEASIYENENDCANQGAHLWAPKSYDDEEFIRLMYKDHKRLHVGWLSYDKKHGIYAIDGSVYPGISFVTHLPDGSQVFDIADSDSSFMTEGMCFFLNVEKKRIWRVESCPTGIGICQKPLGMVAFRTYRKVMA